MLITSDKFCNHLIHLYKEFMPVGCMQILFGKGFLCFPKSNQFAMKEEDLVKVSWNLAEIVMDDQDGSCLPFSGFGVSA